MKETEFFEVRVNAVKSTIEAWAIFGWELKGVPQVINNSAMLTFQRDNSMPNYKELVALEERYKSIKIPSKPDMPPARFGSPFYKLGFIPISGWGILIAIGLLLFVVPGIVIIVSRCVSYSKKKKIYDAEYEEWEKARDKFRNEKTEIQNKAIALL
jgi:hypothetical protein